MIGMYIFKQAVMFVLGLSIFYAFFFGIPAYKTCGSILPSCIFLKSEIQKNEGRPPGAASSFWSDYLTSPAVRSVR